MKTPHQLMKVAARLPRVLTRSGKCHKRKTPISTTTGRREGKRGGGKGVGQGVRPSDTVVTWDSAVALCDILSYGGCCCEWDRERRRRKRRLRREMAQEDVLESTRIEETHPTESMENFEGVPMLEICERPLVWTGEIMPSMFQAYKGQLKLQVYINCGLLTVHVKKAKHLASKWGNTCNAFVKVSVMPNCRKHSRCRTEIVGETNHPVYDEKFSFETLSLDAMTRIVVSVWNHDANKDSTELLGCMSFGTEHIITGKTDACGWYYLLSDFVGARKHLRVINHQAEPLKQKPCWMESQTVSIVRQGSAGYGFRVTGVGPTEVSKVAPGSMAELADLQVGDQILRVNGFYTTTSSSDSVARIIKSCLRRVSLEVQRPKPIDRWYASPRTRIVTACVSDSDMSSTTSSSSAASSSNQVFYQKCIRKLMEGIMR